jgi:hypothetical protein
VNPAGVALALGLSGILVIAPSASAERSDSALLERYRPILRYDAAEEYRAQPVSLPAGTAARRPGDRAYGHVAREGGQTWLQYWFFYAYNPQDRGIVATGRHEGDWEMAQVRLDDGVPVEAVLAQHSWAERCPWGEIETSGAAAQVPVLFVANGSHATYASPGTHGRPFPDPDDEADGAGASVRPPLTPITDGEPAWVDYDGRWGDSEAGWVPGETSSPRGPRFAHGDAWNHPVAFADAARACGTGAPGRPWQLALELGVLALIGLGACGWRRKWRVSGA